MGTTRSWELAWIPHISLSRTLKTLPVKNSDFMEPSMFLNLYYHRTPFLVISMKDPCNSFSVEHIFRKYRPTIRICLLDPLPAGKDAGDFLQVIL